MKTSWFQRFRRLSSLNWPDAAGVELQYRAKADPRGAGVWLGQRLSGVYLGDIVGAEAIRSMADKTGGFSSGVIEGLLSIEPEEELVERSLISLARATAKSFMSRLKTARHGCQTAMETCVARRSTLEPNDRGCTETQRHG